MLAMNTAICCKQTAALKWVLDEVYRDMPIATEVQPQQPTVEEKEQQPPQQSQEEETKSGNEQQHKEEEEEEEDEGLL